MTQFYVLRTINDEIIGHQRKLAETILYGNFNTLAARIGMVFHLLSNSYKLQ